MASSSGSEGYTQEMIMIDERKRKRMESNRESARRSRMRKQKHLDDLMAQIARLSNDNDHIMSEISVRTQQYLNVEAENSVLRAQMAELNQRLESLEEILGFVHAIDGNEFVGDGEVGFVDQSTHQWNMNMNMNMVTVNQPIMASAVDL
ncbi:bZIP transcription factor 44-like protein [Drosera capensis]